jgi:prepilin-type N-terminal cleavage/methylation domain-containing protein/prepilin-type processing-associated H-X9-DG protein
MRFFVDSSRRVRSEFSPAGFSLVELLIVIVLLVVLTSLYWGSDLGSSGKGARRIKECQQNLEKVYLALEIFANDNKGKMPAVAGAQTSEDVLVQLVPRYAVDTSILICPGSSDPSLPAGESLGKHKISYAYYMGRHLSDTNEVLMSDRQIDVRSKKAGEAVFSANGKPPANNHGKAGGNFLFGDGHLESVSSNAPFSLVFDQSVKLLNPKP